MSRYAFKLLFDGARIAVNRLHDCMIIICSAAAPATRNQKQAKQKHSVYAEPLFNEERTKRRKEIEEGRGRDICTVSYSYCATHSVLHTAQHSMPSPTKHEAHRNTMLLLQSPPHQPRTLPANTDAQTSAICALWICAPAVAPRTASLRYQYTTIHYSGRRHT